MLQRSGIVLNLLSRLELKTSRSAAQQFCGRAILAERRSQKKRFCGFLTRVSGLLVGGAWILWRAVPWSGCVLVASGNPGSWPGGSLVAVTGCALVAVVCLCRVVMMRLRRNGSCCLFVLPSHLYNGCRLN